jgi:hypothetical protein
MENTTKKVYVSNRDKRFTTFVSYNVLRDQRGLIRPQRNHIIQARLSGTVKVEVGILCAGTKGQGWHSRGLSRLALLVWHQGIRPA